MIMAFMAIVATSAFAQNPDALKQIKKAKTADNVKALISANEASMSAAENAQAYKKLVDIYMKEVSSAQTTMETNDLQRQFGQEVKDTVDMEAFYENVAGAMEAALACDKYDIQLNEKGKVEPKFRKTNSESLFDLRIRLLEAGQEAQMNQDNNKAERLYTLYVVTGTSDLFKSQIDAAKKASPDGIGDVNLSEVARVASLTAYSNGEVEKALQLTDVMLEDPEKLDEGLNMKMYYIEKSLVTREDSLKCLDTYKELYEKYPKNQTVFSELATMYGSLGQTDNQNALIEQCLQADPQNFSALALKGQIAMNNEDFDGALESLTKALDCEGSDDGQKALINTFVGYCYNQKAAQLEVYDEQIATLKEGIPYLEAARKLDPERERCNWAYPLYNCYYHTKGENDPATVELKDLLGL